jgi:gamma-glutamyltranspeptidase/glutathione hydrolase
LLETLNTLEGYSLRNFGFGSDQAIHVAVEALKLAYGDRERYIADPDFEDVPVETLVSKTYAEAQRRQIRDDVALAWPYGQTMGAHSDTTTFITADRDGNLLVATTSIGRVGLVAGKTGVVLNNRMRMFHEEPDHPNRVAPRKRVRITLNPMMVFKEGRPYLAIASPGSDVQSQAQIQAFLAIVEFGLDPQAAAEAPRWVSTAFPDTSLPHRVAGNLQLEDGFPESVRGDLAKRGHKVQVGRGQGMVAVMQSSIHGGWIAGADPRGETYAIGW